MGFYVVGIRAGEIENGSLTPKSKHKLEETVDKLRDFERIYRSSDPVIYSGKSPEEEMSAKLVAELFGEGYRVKSMFFTRRKLLFFSKKIPVSPSIKVFDKWLSKLYWKGADVVIGVWEGKLLQEHLEQRQRFNPKEVEPLKPGECYITEDHGDRLCTEEDHKAIFPSRNLEIIIGYTKHWTGEPQNT